MLAVEIEQMKPTTPLPLDLFQNFLVQTSYKVTEVLVDSLNNGNYYRFLRFL